MHSDVGVWPTSVGCGLAIADFSGISGEWPTQLNYWVGAVYKEKLCSETTLELAYAGISDNFFPLRAILC